MWDFFDQLGELLERWSGRVGRWLFGGGDENPQAKRTRRLSIEVLEGRAMMVVGGLEEPPPTSGDTAAEMSSAGDTSSASDTSAADTSSAGDTSGCGDTSAACDTTASGDMAEFGAPDDMGTDAAPGAIPTVGAPDDTPPQPSEVAEIVEPIPATPNDCEELQLAQAPQGLPETRAEGQITHNDPDDVAPDAVRERAERLLRELAAQETTLAGALARRALDPSIRFTIYWTKDANPFVQFRGEALGMHLNSETMTFLHPDVKPATLGLGGVDPDKVATIVIGHELGHAILELTDPTEGNADGSNVTINENPLRDALGVPPRPNYQGTAIPTLGAADIEEVRKATAHSNEHSINPYIPSLPPIIPPIYWLDNLPPAPVPAVTAGPTVEPDPFQIIVLPDGN